MRFLYNNLLDSATLSSDGGIPGFALANMQDTRLSRTYRSISTTDNIVIDLGSATAVDTFCMGNHNIEATEITLEANSSDAWVTPAFTSTVTVADIIYHTFTAQTYRYWRVVIVDPTNAFGQIEIGRIGIGAQLQGPSVGLDLQIPSRSTTERGYSRTRQAYFNEGKRYKSCSFQFNNMDSTDKAALEAMFEYTDVSPIFVDFDELSQEGAFYANIGGEFDFSYVGNGSFYTLNLDFEEVF